VFTAQDVQRAFPNATLGAPCAAASLAKAEARLGHAIPEQLRSLYLVFDGFLGPTNAPFLLPLLQPARAGAESLTSYTEFFRTEPGMPAWLQHAVVVGDNGTGTGWFVLLNEGNHVVRWDAEWEEFESVEGNLLDDWCREKAFYESLKRDA
jgi:hypothetical protein